MQHKQRRLCGNPVRDALRAIGQWPFGLDREPEPADFSEEERFAMFRAVLHEHVWPLAELSGAMGRTAISWTHSVWSWRHGGRKRFEKQLEQAARQELAAAEYATFDLSSLRQLIGFDGLRYCRLLRAMDEAKMEQRLNGMKADLTVIDRKLDAFRENGETFGELRYRVDFYEKSYEAVIRGGRGGWLWTMLAP